MEEPSGTKPPCHQADALAVIARLRQAGHVAYFAGGCVRDMLMGLAPKDYDVATDAAPQAVRKIFPDTQAVGVAFGVILVRQSKSVVEVATFRTDGPYGDGRRPDSVRFATDREDAQRRDFTINGLFLDPVANTVIDYVGGRADLASRKIRAIGEARRRFEEDHLRLLRAVRFASRFDFEIEPDTASAIRHAAPRLKGISPERISEELRLMLTAITRRRAWPLLWELGLGSEIFRQLPGSMPSARSIFLALRADEAIPYSLALAAAVLDVRMGTVADPRVLLENVEVRRSVQAMRKTLRLSNDETDEIEGALAGLAPLLADISPRLAVKKRFLARPTAAFSRRLLAALATVGCHPDRGKTLETEFLELENTQFAPPPLISGDDLAAAGLHPGPLFRRVLAAIYDEQLEGQISTRQEAMEMALRMAKT